MKRHFSSFIEAFAEYSQYVEASDKYIRWSAISAIAGALERRVWIRFNGTMPVFPNMFVMLIGPAGLAKKSSSSAMAMNLLYPQKELKFMSTNVTASELVKQVHQSGLNRLFNFEGKVYNNSSIFLYSSEAANSLKEVAGSVMELLTDFYDCNQSFWSNDRAWSKGTIGNGETKIFNPCINMLACSTPQWLLEIVGHRNIEGGFASRIIFVVQRGKSEKSVGWIESLPDMSTMQKDLTTDLSTIAKINGEFRVDKDWKTVFNELKKKSDNYLANHPDDKMQGYHARKLWHSMKLAQVLAIDKSNDLVVTGENLIKADQWLTELEPEMYHAFGATGKNPDAIRFQQAWEKLKKHPVFTRKQMTSLLFTDMDQKKRDDFLTLLRDLGRIDHKPSPTGGIQYHIIDQSPI